MARYIFYRPAYSLHIKNLRAGLQEQKGTGDMPFYSLNNSTTSTKQVLLSVLILRGDGTSWCVSLLKDQNRRDLIRAELSNKSYYRSG